jgi:hypothetical protein
MKKVLLAATAMALATTALPAKADIVLFGLSDVLSFVDVGAQGFGNFHRALTLQTNGIESGGRLFGNVKSGDAIDGADKGNTPTIGQLGWMSGANVGIGFNTDQAGQHDGITMQSLNMVVWNTAGAPVFTAHLATSPINFSATALALQAGNGNAVFDFELNAAERAEFNAMLAANPGNAAFTVGLSSTLGCSTPVVTGCLVSDDGPDSFVLFNQTLAAVPGPIVGAGLPGLLAACLGLVGLNWRRRKRQGLVA